MTATKLIDNDNPGAMAAGIASAVFDGENQRQLPFVAEATRTNAQQQMPSVTTVNNIESTTISDIRGSVLGTNRWNLPSTPPPPPPSFPPPDITPTEESEMKPKFTPSTEPVLKLASAQIGQSYSTDSLKNRQHTIFDLENTGKY